LGDQTRVRKIRNNESAEKVRRNVSRIDDREEMCIFVFVYLGTLRYIIAATRINRSTRKSNNKKNNTFTRRR